LLYVLLSLCLLFSSFFDFRAATVVVDVAVVVATFVAVVVAAVVGDVVEGV